MADFIQITTTTSNRQDADKIAAELVTRRLAGCVQVGGPIVSTYRWQGRIETAEEWTCTIKTGRSQLAAIKAVFCDIHPYDVPELIVTPIAEGGDAYLCWLGEQLGN
jgi:periplasmic divalent cation tolerance protein